MKHLKYILLLIGFFLLSGCTQQNYSITINEDETIKFEISIKISETTAKQLKEYDLDTDIFQRDISNVFAPYMTKLQENDFKVETANDNLSYGFKATKVYPSKAYFNNDIKKMQEAGTLTGLNVSISKNDSLLNKDYIVVGTLSYVIDDYFVDKTNSVDNWKSVVPINDMVANLTVSSSVGKMFQVNGTRDIQGNIANFVYSFNPDADPINNQVPIDVGVKYRVENVIAKSLIVIGVVLAVVITFIVWKVLSNKDDKGQTLMEHNRRRNQSKKRTQSKTITKKSNKKLGNRNGK